MNGKAWSADEVATLKRMAVAGYSDAEIAQHLGRDRDVVGRKRRQSNIRPGISPALTAMMARINARRISLTFQSRSYA
jgi:hypothetical protein